MVLRISGREGHGRGKIRRKLVANAKVMEELRDMCARMEAMQATRHRDPDASDDNEPKQEISTEEEREEEFGVRLLKVFAGTNSNPKPEVPNYSGSFNPKEWVG